MEQAKKFQDITAGIDTVILVSARRDGTLHARPMALARLEPNGRAYFASAIDSPKIAELDANPHAVATFQGSKTFATLSGTVSLSRDPGLIDSLWQDDWAIWFPGGKTDPQLCILVLTGTVGEYWDSAGLQDVAYRLAAMGAALTGGDPAQPREEHGTVTF
jgi:general stress protein 26